MGSTREYLGEFEQVVLLALARLKDGGYGAEIHAEILDTTGRDVSIPAVYVTLKRLEAKAYVASAMRDPEDGGRTKKVYTLEADGHAALGRSRELLDRLWDGAHVDPGAVS